MGLGLMAGAGRHWQHEVLAEGEWDVGAEVSLPDFEIFRLFKLPFLSEMDICPAHTLMAPGHRILRSFGKGKGRATEIAEPLGLQKGLRFLCVHRESSIYGREGRCG